MKRGFSVSFVLGAALCACLAWGVDLPDGYVSQGCLQSDGTAWIDTGYCPNEKTRLESVFTAEAAAAQGERAVGSLSGDPVFRNLAKRNYRLKPGSPCRDAGHVWAGADDPSVLDLDGKRLSQFGRIDIGCHSSNRNGMTVVVR